MLEVEAQAAFVAVDHLIQVAGVAAHRTQGARVVAGTGVLDLDHIGTVVGEMLGGERAGQQAGQVKHAHAGQRQAGLGFRIVGHGQESDAPRAPRKVRQRGKTKRAQA